MNFPELLFREPSRCWQQVRDAARHAGDRHSLLVGFSESGPNLLPLSALEAHTYVVGSSNSGKSSRVLSPLLEQLTLQGHPVWVGDCKHDALLLGSMHAAAKAAGRKLNLFSLEPGMRSEFALDFFSPLLDAGRSPRHIAEILVGSLGLDKARESYFVTQNSSALRAAIQKSRDRGRVSFRSIAHELRGLLLEKRFEHCGQALDVMEGLADVPELNPGKGSSLPTKDVRELISELCYFCIPVTTELKLTAATTASVLLKLTVLVSKQLAQQQGRVGKRIYFAIDEFQDVAAASDIKDLMAQVRGVGGGISLILAHQVEEQLMDYGLRALRRSAGLIIHLTPRGQARLFQEWSGEKTEWLQNESYSESHRFGEATNRSHSISYGEQIRPALDLNVIIDINSLPGAALMSVQGGRPIPAYFPHHISAAEARAREQTGTARPSPPLPVRQGRRPTPKRVASTKPTAQKTPQSDLGARIEKLALRILATTLVSKRRCDS